MSYGQDKFRLLVENLPDGFLYLQMVSDGEGNPVDFIIREVNPAFEKITGFSREGVRGRKATEVFSGIVESEFDWIDTCGKVALTGENIRVKRYFEVAGCRCDIVVYSDERGFCAVIFRDITFENSLRESKEKYRQLVENLNEVIYVLDENANITYISPNVERISGYTPAELAKMPFTEFVHPDDVEGRMNQFLKIMSGANEATEYRFLTKDGRTVWVRTAARPVVKEGRVVGVQGVLTDISERKQAEEELRYLSFHDTLTGLYNRFYLEEEARRLDTERQLPIGIVMADMNDLKLVNDTYGHRVGDEMLEQAANILRASCRKEDIIARWGGDEFIIFLPQTEEQTVKEICSRINEKCRSAYVKEVPIFIALGYAIKQSAPEDLAEAFKEAEDKMYQQKLIRNQNEESTLLNAFLKTLREKSFETEEHFRRMQEAAIMIGEAIGLSSLELSRLKILITLHDIGKINTPENILTKRDVLTEAEWALVKKHPETGYRIARATKEYAHVAEEILSHHERWDGKGYPRGLKREEIPLLSRITAIADAYEGMITGRGYQEPKSINEARAELEKGAGNQFDPALVRLFLSAFKKSGGR